MKNTAVLSFFVAAVTLFSVAASAQTSSPSQWAAAEINSDLLRSYCDSSDTADFSAPVTKADMVKILMTAYLMEGGSFEISVSNSFSDLTDPLLLTAYGLGLAEGESETEFVPKKELTRLDALCLVYSAEKLLYGYSAEDAESFSQYVDSVHSYSDIDAVGDSKAAVGCALMRGTVVGIDNTALGLDLPCTLEQALVLVSRGLLNE